MFEKETIKHIVAYLKVRIAEAVLEKIDNEYVESPEACEYYDSARFRLNAYENVLEELEEYYGQETG